MEIQNINVELTFNGDNAYQYIEDQLDIGFRIPGTQERINCANYFIAKFLEIDSNFSYVEHNFTTHLTDCQNILFKLNEHHEKIVILGAHYDSRAKATKDPVLLNRMNPVPGANDGASGSALLIELANVLYQKKDELSVQIWFLFFDAEDQGYDNDYGLDGWGWCEGSTAFVGEINNFYNSLSETFECMILFDMVGGTNLQFIDEGYSTSSLLDEIFGIGRALGYSTQFPSTPTTASIIDDHTAFKNIGIPSADLIINFWNSPNWAYHHTVQDDLTHISNSSLEITGRTMEQFIFNNYLEPLNQFYDGNHPWTVDIDKSEVDTLVFLIITIGVISLVILVIYYYKSER
ncbi:MAG: M28 family peptidase [Promethearchaeota archaeon]